MKSEKSFIVEIKNLTKKFGAKIAVNELSLNIEKGKIIGLTGIDGSGKTTLIKMITGELKPDNGEISVLGFSPFVQKEKLNPHISYMPQRFNLYENLTVIENLCLFADLKSVKIKAKDGKCNKNDDKNIQKILRLTELNEIQFKPVNTLTYAMRQKLGLACTLLGEPEFLIFDETSTDIDEAERKDLIKTVKAIIQPKTTVLWVTKYFDEAYNCDVVTVLDKGKIIYFGRPYDLAPTKRTFEKEIMKLIPNNKPLEFDSSFKTSLIKNINTTPFKSQTFPSYENKNKNAPIKNIYSIQTEKLSKRYGSVYAIKDVTLKIKKGEIYGLFSRQGAGKSTLIKMLYGITKPTFGTICIENIDVKKDPKKAREKFGYMSQKFSLYGSLTIRKNLEFFAFSYGIKQENQKKKVDEIINSFGLKNYENQKAEDLPLGIKQRLAMAAAILNNPVVLFLDEPTLNIDKFTRLDFWKHINSLAKNGTTVVIVISYEEEAKLCDRIGLLHNGKIIMEGTIQELKNKTAEKDINAVLEKLR